MNTSHFQFFVTACSLLHIDREDLRNFIVSATGDGDRLIDLVTTVTFLASARNLDQLIDFLQLQINFIDDVITFKTVTSDRFSDGRLRSGWRCRVESVEGFYAIGADGRCLMSSSYYQHLTDQIEQLKAEIENTYGA